MDLDKARLFNEKTLNQDEEGEARLDRIRGRNHSKRKKFFR